MTKDYYKILRIEKSAREEDIKKAYHNLALRYHPDKNKEPNAEQRFKEILEAYQVLSDKQRRYKYDTDVELSAEHKSKKTFSPWTNPYDAYDRNNLTLGAFINFLSKIKHSKVYRFDMYGPSKVGSQQPKEPPVEHDIYVTLEELNYGVTRKVKFSRLAYGGMRREDKVFEVNVRPGCKAGTKILFPREGDRVPGNIPADLIFVIRDKPHAIFERVGSDLKYTSNIPLHMALNGNFVISVPTLDGKLMQLTIKDEIIKPSTVKFIPRKGLPNYNDPQKRGNLMVTFKIKYPESMTAKTRRMIAKNLFH